VNHGPRGYCLMKKTEGRKSRDTVPLIDESPSIMEIMYSIFSVKHTVFGGPIMPAQYYTVQYALYSMY
jgi:hypothetical protein